MNTNPERVPAADGRVRPATPDEAEALSALARRSKAHWGYDAAFMEACRDELTVGAADIRSGRIFVYDDGAGPLGFYRLDIEGDAADVGLFFVEPDTIGKGVGRALWDHLEAEARRAGKHRITIEADPQAAGFYERMGATPVGTVASVSVPGRTLPLLERRLAD